MRCVVTVMLSFALLAGVSGGDIIVLKGGTKLDGRVVSDSGDRVIIELRHGTVTIPKDRIERIERERPSDWYLRTVRECRKSGRFDTALVMLLKAARSGAADSAVREEKIQVELARGRKALQYGDFAECEKSLDDARRIFQDDPRIEELVFELRKRRADHSEALTRARNMLSYGQYEQAVELLEEVLRETEAIPEDIRDNLGRTYVVLGDKALSGSKYKEAAGFYRKALDTSPELAEVVGSRYAAARLPEALELVRQRKVEEAEELLDELVETAPADRQLRYVRGRVYELMGHWDFAAYEYARALRKDIAGIPGADVAAGLRKEIEALLSGRRPPQPPPHPAHRTSEPGWFTWETAQCIVYHLGDVGAADSVAEAAEVSLDRILRFLGRAAPVLKPGKLRIFLYDDEESYIAGTRQRKGTSGVTRLDPNAATLDEMSVATFKTANMLINSVIPHEVAHIVLGRTVPGTAVLPTAIHEGFATSMEGRWSQLNRSRSLQYALANGIVLPVEKLFGQMPKENQIYFYAQAHSVIGLLLERGGDEKMSSGERFAAMCSRAVEAGVSTALKEVYGIEDGLVGLEQIWLERMAVPAR